MASLTRVLVGQGQGLAWAPAAHGVGAGHWRPGLTPQCQARGPVALQAPGAVRSRTRQPGPLLDAVRCPRQEAPGFLSTASPGPGTVTTEMSRTRREVPPLPHSSPSCPPCAPSPVGRSQAVLQCPPPAAQSQPPRVSSAGHGLWVHGQLLLAREGDRGVELHPEVGTDLHAHPQPQTSMGGGKASGGGGAGSRWAVLAPGSS